MVYLFVEWKPISELRIVTCHMGLHSVTCILLPDTGERAARIIFARQAGTRFIFPWRMEGWVDLGVASTLSCLPVRRQLPHPSTNHVITTHPEVKPTTSLSQVQRSSYYTTKPFVNNDFIRQLQTISRLFVTFVFSMRCISTRKIKNDLYVLYFVAAWLWNNKVFISWSAYRLEIWITQLVSTARSKNAWMATAWTYLRSNPNLASYNFACRK